MHSLENTNCGGSGRQTLKISLRRCCCTRACHPAPKTRLDVEFSGWKKRVCSCVRSQWIIFQVKKYFCLSQLLAAEIVLGESKQTFLHLHLSCTQLCLNISSSCSFWNACFWSIWKLKKIASVKLHQLFWHQKCFLSYFKWNLLASHLSFANVAKQNCSCVDFEMCFLSCACLFYNFFTQFWSNLE